MNPMPVWELIVLGLAGLLAAFSMVLPLYVGERLDQREQAMAARKKASVPMAANPGDDQASRGYESAA